jgi:non-specific serine/threonine protein kinase/serine/threonine-protein kinase
MYEQAEVVTKSLWDLQRKLLGETNPLTLGTMEQLELEYLEDGKSELAGGLSAQAKANFARAEELATQHLALYLAGSGVEDTRSTEIRRRLGDIYESQAEYKKAEEEFRTIRKLAWPAENDPRRAGTDPRVRSSVSHLGWALFHQQKFAEAETVLSEIEGAFEDPGWGSGLRYNWEGVLGASLVAQKKYAAAEGHLLGSYKGRIQPSGLRADEPILFSAQEAVQWLIRLYDEWGKPEEAAKWREKLGAEILPR